MCNLNSNCMVSNLLFLIIITGQLMLVIRFPGKDKTVIILFLLQSLQHAHYKRDWFFDQTSTSSLVHVES
jgi:hypothetical protein